MTQHWSSCAVHNEPAYPAGECDCGGMPEGKSVTAAATIVPRAELFVVYNEGESATPLPYGDWKREVDGGVPIFGVRLGETYIVHDRILTRHRVHPVRIGYL